jgi:putative solute:sodium symporter small subunit
MPTDLVDPAASPRSAAARARGVHWRRTRRLTAALLVAWFVAGYGVTWFARDLSFAFFGWPFSFWVAAQGGGIVFVLLLAAYTRRMATLDRRLEAEGGQPEPSASVF